MWEWVQIRPGMMVFPVQSICSASAGMSTFSEGPTEMMVSPLIRRVPFAILPEETG